MTQIDENKPSENDGCPSSPVTPSQLPSSAVPQDGATCVPNVQPNNDEAEINREVRSYSICEKLRFLRSNITVEPLLIFYIIPSVLTSLATQNLNLEKACRVNLALGDRVCTSLELRDTSNYTGHETRVQQMVAEMQIWKTMLQSSVPVILIMFLGSWSDRHRRRKPCMLLPIIGDFLTSVSLIVCTYFFYELPMQVTGVFEAVLSAMTGGWKTMFMAVYSFLGDISTDEDRTLRIGIVNTVYYVGIPIGTALSGILYNKCGPYTVLSIAALLNVCSFLYGLLRIQERKHPPPPDLLDKLIKEPQNVNVSNHQQSNNMASSKKKKQRCFLSRFARDFFDLQHITEIFDVAFRKASVRRRKKTFALIMIVVFIFGPKRGEMTVMYLFTRYRFNWNEVDYSVFSTYSMVTNLIGTLFSVGVFSHMLKIDDALIGVMSCMSKIMAGFVYAFATTTWMIYLAPLVDIVNGTSFIAMRSIASKLVPPEELGKVNSLFGVCEALMPLVYGPMYSAVYASTMHTMPGAFFLLGGALTTPAVLIFAWMYTEHKKDELLAKISKENECKKENGDIKTQSDTVKIQVIATPPVGNNCPAPFTGPPPTGHQPQEAGFVNKAFEADEISRSTS